MKSIKCTIAGLLLAAALMIGVMPAMAEPAFAADDHDGWQSVNKLIDMWNEDENGMAVVETIGGTGEYYLTGNLTMDRPLLVKGGTTVTICLHGHSISVPSDKDAQFVFYIEEGATLNIENCSTGGSISNLNPACYAAIFNEGELNISGGSIGSNQSAIISENGKVTISGGAINAGNAAINMSGGILDVSGYAEITGPDIGIIMQGGKLNISGGIVKSTKPGSMGIMMPGFATASISGGEIMGVKYGLQALGDSTVNFSGGEISCETSLTDSFAILAANSNLNISAGDLSMPIMIGPIDAQYSNVDIRGGYFTDSPGAFLNEAYKIVPSSYPSYPYSVVEKDKFTVTFTNGAGDTVDVQTVYEGFPAEEPSAPVRQGYAFKGWDADFSNITADLTVNAQWEKLNTVIKDLSAVKLTKVKPAKKSATVCWKKISKKKLQKIKKVQIQYCRNKNFNADVRTKYVAAKKTSCKVKGLKSAKTYYFRVRAYTKSGGITHVSKWSSIKKAKVK